MNSQVEEGCVADEQRARVEAPHGHLVHGLQRLRLEAIVQHAACNRFTRKPDSILGSGIGMGQRFRHVPSEISRAPMPRADMGASLSYERIQLLIKVQSERAGDERLG